MQYHLYVQLKPIHRTTGPLTIPHITTSLRSSHVQAVAGPQNYVTSDFMQANPFSSSTGTAPTFVTPIIPPTYGPTVPNP